jgi:hypothetical protein
MVGKNPTSSPSPNDRLFLHFRYSAMLCKIWFEKNQEIEASKGAKRMLRQRQGSALVFTGAVSI